MVNPRSYPELLGKALVLEAEPFAVMTDDDNPWMEGLFFVVCLGVLIGIAQFVGGILLTASLPPVEALREASVMLLRQAIMLTPTDMLNSQAVDADLRRFWEWAAFGWGYGGGWARLLWIVITPGLLIVVWLAYGAVSFVAARWLGGVGTLNQTLGVTALAFAPQVLLLLTAIPFVQVGWPLLLVWALLIGFRGLEVAHDLSWQRSVLAALAGPILFLLVALGGIVLLTFALLFGVPL